LSEFSIATRTKKAFSGEMLDSTEKSAPLSGLKFGCGMARSSRTAPPSGQLNRASFVPLKQVDRHCCQATVQISHGGFGNELGSRILAKKKGCLIAAALSRPERDAARLGIKAACSMGDERATGHRS
jgi:hypothetical protein